MFSTTLFDDEFRGLYIDVLWTLFMFHLCGIFSVILFCLVWILHIMSVLFPLEEVFILKRHDISLTRNGADVFICWFDDCLSNITWNKTMSTRSALIRFRLLNVAGKPLWALSLSHVTVGISKFTWPAVANVYQSLRSRTQDQQHKAFVEETAHSWPKKEQHILQFSQSESSGIPSYSSVNGK